MLVRENSTDESGYSSYALFHELLEKKVPGVEMPKLWSGVKGEKAKPVRDLDLEVWPLLDEMIAEKAGDFIKRKASDGVPFYSYIAFTHFHPPEAVHPDFDQKSPERNGLYADIIAEQDYRTGQILDAIDQAGITDNTFVVVCSDNAAGAKGVNMVPGGSNALDGIDASQYMLGNASSTGREYVLFAGPDGDLMSVKYGQVKVVFRYSEGMDKPIVKPQFPMVYDLASDPGEEFNLMFDKLDMMFMFAPAFQALTEYKLSLVKYPNIKPSEEFKGYRGVSHLAHEGEAAVAEYELHHHAG